jgi:hypothetical protein
MAEGSAFLLIHEYGRTYLMDKLTKDTKREPLPGDRDPPVSALEYIENWDQFIESLAKNYKTIKTMK